MNEVLPDSASNDRRGSDGAPAEGRRAYDHVDAAVAEHVSAIERSFATMRNRILVVAALATAVTGGLSWLGARNIGPGARADAIEAQMKENWTIQFRRDSIRDLRMDRVERVQMSISYQLCVSRPRADEVACARAFTDGVP